MTANLAKCVPVVLSAYGGYQYCARSLKDYCDYETVKVEVQRLGHTITAIFDPSTDTEISFISCFAEPEEAVKFLTYKRGR